MVPPLAMATLNTLPPNKEEGEDTQPMPEPKAMSHHPMVPTVLPGDAERWVHTCNNQASKPPKPPSHRDLQVDKAVPNPNNPNKLERVSTVPHHPMVAKIHTVLAAGRPTGNNNNPTAVLEENKYIHHEYTYSARNEGGGVIDNEYVSI